MMTQAAHATPQTTPFHPEAGCPRWLQFLEESIQDAANIHSIREWMAACLGDGPNEKALYLHGAGSNGKSTLLSVLVELAGAENAVGIDFSDTVSELHCANIRGKKLVIDWGYPDPANMPLIKALLSGETIIGRKRYRQPFEFKPICSLVFHANTDPDFERLGEGCRRRMLVVPFRRQFHRTEADPSLKDKLLSELPAVREWAEAAGRGEP